MELNNSKTKIKTYPRTLLKSSSTYKHPADLIMWTVSYVYAVFSLTNKASEVIEKAKSIKTDKITIQHNMQ